MKKLLLLTLTSLVFISSASAQFLAGTDFTSDLPEYQVGFTLSDSSNSVTAVGSDAIGNSFSLYFDTAVDMSALSSSNSASLEFVANSGHAANSSFSISLFDAGFAASYDISGFNFSDSSLIGAGTNGGVDLSAIAGMTITTGGLTGSNVNVDVQSFTVVPEPSTYALIAGFAAFLFVAIRRRK
jgi:hypothetical protein